MTKIKRPVNIHENYHAHIYFDSKTLHVARNLCQQAGELFDVKIGRVHQKPVGPHPLWSCQISFTNKVFDQLIPWLNDHRNGLSVFVHGQTGDSLEDHTTHAYWLGDSAQLDLSIFIA